MQTNLIFHIFWLHFTKIEKNYSNYNFIPILTKKTIVICIPKGKINNEQLKKSRDNILSFFDKMIKNNNEQSKHGSSWSII